MIITGGILGANLFRDLSISIGNEGMWHWEVLGDDMFESMFEGLNRYALPSYGDEKLSVEENEIRSLNVAVKGGELEIVKSGNRSDGNILISVESTGKSWYAIDEDGTLVIGMDAHWRGSYGKIVIDLPADVTFERVEVSLGGGEANIGRLEADKVDIQLGAGEMYVASVYAKEFSAQVGAGELDIEKACVTEEINMDVGVGEMDVIIWENSDNIDIKCGMGEVSLCFAENYSLQNYNYDVTCGAGEISIGNQNMSGIGMHRDIDNGASRKISIDCGMGEVEIVEGEITH